MYLGFQTPKAYKVIDHAQAFYCAAEFSLEKGFVVQPPLMAIPVMEFQVWEYKIQ